MRYRLFEIDCFTGQQVLEPLTELECEPDQLARIADQLSEFYRILRGDGSVALEKLPVRMIRNQRVPVAELFYGVLDPEQAGAMFPGGVPASTGKGSPFTEAVKLVRSSVTPGPVEPGAWVPARKIPKLRNPVSLPKIGHIDCNSPVGTVRVSFLGKLG
jgi:hypothetical protein